jgi:hypothetical protein
LWFLPTTLQLRRGEFVVFSPFLHQRIGARYRGITVAAQEISRPVAANFDVFAMEHSGEGQGVAANPASPGFEGQIARIEAMTYDGPPATPQRTSPSTSGSAEPPCIDIWPRTTPPPDQVDADEDGQPPGLGTAIRQ